MVSASDSQSGGAGVKSLSGHLLDLLSVVPSSNSRPNSKKPTGCLPPVEVSNPVMFYLDSLFLII